MKSLQAKIFPATTILLLITFLKGTGQAISLTSDSDASSYSYSWYSELLEKLQVPPITSYPNEQVFRYRDAFKIIQINNTSDKLEGTVTYYLQEYNPKGGEGRIYKSHLRLTEESIIKINQLLSDFDIENLPTDKQIKGWKSGTDGRTYTIEQFRNNKHSFKKYWTPSLQNHLKEGRYMEYFIHEINQIKEISSAFDKFMAKQPFKSYYNGYGGMSIVTIQ